MYASRKVLMKSKGLLVCCFVILFAPTANAVPLISVDLDPGTDEIQSELTVAAGTSFTIDIVFTGDGVSLFDTTVLNVLFNSAVLSLGPGTPRAGTLAGTAGDTADVFGGVPVDPNDPLTPLGPSPGFSGYVGLVSSGFAPVAPGVNIDMFNLSFVASAPGMSTLSTMGLSPGQELALGGELVASSLVPGAVTVTDAVIPEPSTLLLLGTGLIGVFAYARRRKRSG
jgi:hypothetical protein